MGIIVATDFLISGVKNSFIKKFFFRSFIIFVILCAAFVHFVPPVFASTWKCCPREFTRCDGGSGADRTVCIRHGHANLLPIPNWGDDNWCGNGDFSLGVLLTTDQIERSYLCDRQTGAPLSGMTCGWTTIDGMHAFCASVDAEYREGLAAARIAFGCTENCGGAGARWLDAAFGSSTQQYITVGDENIETYQDGRHYACFGGEFDASVKNAIQSCLNDAGYACLVGSIPGAVGGFVVGGATHTYVLSVPAGTLGGCIAGTELNNLLQSCVATIMGRVSAGSIGACASTFEIEIQEGELTSDVGGARESYNICTQIPVLSDDQIQAQVDRIQGEANQERVRLQMVARREKLLEEKQNCCECAGTVLNQSTGKCQAQSEIDSPACSAGLCNFSAPVPSQEKPGIYTAVGCIRADSQSIVSALVKIALGISGGVALLMILAGSFMITTSAGEIKRVEQGREMISSAIMGVIFITFSVTILEFIGVSILQIPGFGK